MINTNFTKEWQVYISSTTKGYRKSLTCKGRNGEENDNSIMGRKTFDLHLKQEKQYAPDTDFSSC